VSRRVAIHLDLPGLDPQEVDDRGPWMFLDEAPNPAVVVPGAVLVGGEPDWPLLVRVVDVTGAGRDRLVHVDVLDVLFPCDLNFEGDEPGVVLAPVPTAGVPPLGAVVFAGTSRAAWSRARVEAVEDGWLHLRLLTGRNAG
jgi:hypothetical protein